MGGVSIASCATYHYDKLTQDQDNEVKKQKQDVELDGKITKLKIERSAKKDK